MKKNLLAKYQKYSKLWKSSVPSEWLRTEEKNHDFSAKQVRTLLALYTPTLTGVIFRDMALKGPALHARLWDLTVNNWKITPKSRPALNYAWCNNSQQGITIALTGAGEWEGQSKYKHMRTRGGSHVSANVYVNICSI